MSLSKGGSSSPGISLFNFTQKTVCAIHFLQSGIFLYLRLLHATAGVGRQASLGFRRGLSVVRQNLREFLAAYRRTRLAISCSLRNLALHANINRVVRLVAQVFHFVLVGRKPASLATLGVDFGDLAVLVGEPEVSIRQRYRDAGRMLVHL